MPLTLWRISGLQEPLRAVSLEGPSQVEIKELWSSTVSPLVLCVCLECVLNTKRQCLCTVLESVPWLVSDNRTAWHRSLFILPIEKSSKCSPRLTSWISIGAEGFTQWIWDALCHVQGFCKVLVSLEHQLLSSPFLTLLFWLCIPWVLTGSVFHECWLCAALPLQEVWRSSFLYHGNRCSCFHWPGASLMLLAVLLLLCCYGSQPQGRWAKLPVLLNWSKVVVLCHLSSVCDWHRCCPSFCPDI